METFSQAIPRVDFSHALKIQLPVQLDPRVHDYLSARAQTRGVALDELVNELLKKSIELSWKLGV